MTRDEAAGVLGLGDDRSAAAVKLALDRRIAEVNQQHRMAATPERRAELDRERHRLTQAYDDLRDESEGPGADGHQPGGGGLSTTKIGDLPGDGLSLTGPIPRGSDGGDTGPVPGLAPGQVLAERFDVRERLGSGGMGVVHAAFDRVRGEEVAIKVLLPQLLDDSRARDRFLSEARIASSLSHPNIVRVHDVHQTARYTFLSMERLQGQTLRDELAARAATARRFGVEEVRKIVGPLCGALQYAHGHTVHRDVKPENIWLCTDGTVKLMDFGIARLLRPSRFTSTGLALGTAYYMAPEQLRGSDVDHRADQYAVGVVLYELLTGEVPQGVFRAPAELRPGVPAVMSLGVMRALQKSPEDRHADMAALCRQLDSPGGNTAARWSLAAACAATLLAVLVVVATLPRWQPTIAQQIGLVPAEKSGPEAKGPGTTRANSPSVPAPKVAGPTAPVPAPVPAPAGPGRDAPASLEDWVGPPGRTWKNSLGMEFSLIPPGEFDMGSDSSDKDADADESVVDPNGIKRKHHVKITEPFYLGRTEVTRGQFRQFVEAGNTTDAETGNPKGSWGWNGEKNKPEWHPEYRWHNAGFPQKDNHPVVHVSWNDAVKFCEWLSQQDGATYRLPTEAEWEYACRAGTTTKYFTGDKPEDLAKAGNIADAMAKDTYPVMKWAIDAPDGHIHTAPVKQYNPNKWELFDMHGNVWEWCSDVYDADYYKESPSENPQGPPQAPLRVIRGGGWSGGPCDARSADRHGHGHAPEFRNCYLGFRLARVRSSR